MYKAVAEFLSIQEYNTSSEKKIQYAQQKGYQNVNSCYNIWILDYGVIFILFCISIFQWRFITFISREKQKVLFF